MCGFLFYFGGFFLQEWDIKCVDRVQLLLLLLLLLLLRGGRESVYGVCTCLQN